MKMQSPLLIILGWLQLPGTRKVFHFFIRFTDCVVAVQTITSDSSDSKEFSFLTRNLLQVKFYQLLIFSTFMILITAKESGWKFYMKMNPTLALLLVWIYLINLLVVSVWFLLRVSTGSLSLKGIQFGIVSLISLGNQIMIQQWTDKVVCTNYKHLIRAYHWYVFQNTQKTVIVPVILLFSWLVHRKMVWLT